MAVLHQRVGREHNFASLPAPFFASFASGRWSIDESRCFCARRGS